MEPIQQNVSIEKHEKELEKLNQKIEHLRNICFSQDGELQETRKTNFEISESKISQFFQKRSLFQKNQEKESLRILIKKILLHRICSYGVKENIYSQKNAKCFIKTCFDAFNVLRSPQKIILSSLFSLIIIFFGYQFFLEQEKKLSRTGNKGVQNSEVSQKILQEQAAIIHFESGCNAEIIEQKLSVASNLTEINLSKTQVEDQQLELINRFPNLKTGYLCCHCERAQASAAIPKRFRAT